MEAGLGIALHVRRHHNAALDLRLDARPPVVDQFLLRGTSRRLGLALGLIRLTLLAHDFLLLALAFSCGHALLAILFAFGFLHATLFVQALLLLGAVHFLFLAQLFLFRALLLLFVALLFLGGLALVVFEFALFLFDLLLLFLALCVGFLLVLEPRGFFFLLLAQFFLEFAICVPPFPPFPFPPLLP